MIERKSIIIIETINMHLIIIKSNEYTRIYLPICMYVYILKIYIF